MKDLYDKFNKVQTRACWLAGWFAFGAAVVAAAFWPWAVTAPISINVINLIFLYDFVYHLIHIYTRPL